MNPFAAEGGLGAGRCSLRKKRYFTSKFAYVFEKYAKLSFRIPDPPLKVTQLPYAQRICADRREHYSARAVALAAQGRGGSRGLRPFRRGRARKRT